MTADEMTEEALMAAYCDGDSAAFERLFATLGPRLHGFFMRSFGSVAVADDLIQTTFLKLHRARSEYRRDERLRPWVFAIAARVRLDEYRRRKRLAEDFDEDALARADERQEAAGAGAHTALPDSNAESQDVTKIVQAALADLTETQRTIVHLHRYEGLTMREIASVLGTTEGAVRLRAFRAYGQLRKRLAPLVTMGERG